MKSLIILFALFALAFGDGRLRFIFYRTPTDTEEYNVVDFHTILNHPQFRRNVHTVMFHYGAGQTLVTPQVHDLVSAYATNGNFNYVVVHYDSPDTIATGNANDLAEGISTALINLFDNGYSSGLMDLLGHSLGAQIMARASRRVQARTSRRHIIGRLTGLDPWALGTISQITTGVLSSADAQWVESIHTEGSMRGDHDSRGHVAFFVNGGVTQPFCTGVLASTRADCSHIFSLLAWAESVRATTPVFGSLQCDSWEQFTAGVCNGNGVAFMGRSNSASNLRGTFFLQTNMQAPWSRDQAQP